MARAAKKKKTCKVLAFPEPAQLEKKLESTSAAWWDRLVEMERAFMNEQAEYMESRTPDRKERSVDERLWIEANMLLGAVTSLLNCRQRVIDGYIGPGPDRPVA